MRSEPENPTLSDGESRSYGPPRTPGRSRSFREVVRNSRDPGRFDASSFGRLLALFPGCLAQRPIWASNGPLNDLGWPHAPGQRPVWASDGPLSIPPRCGPQFLRPIWASNGPLNEMGCPHAPSQRPVRASYGPLAVGVIERCRRQSHPGSRPRVVSSAGTGGICPTELGPTPL